MRAHFLDASEENLAYASLKLSQASMCELLAIKLLRHFSTSPIQLVAALTLNWSPVAGATPAAIHAIKYEMNAEDDDLVEPASAIELAIATSSKHFIASYMVQNVINDIYTGRVVYNVPSTRSLVADNYKRRTIQFYDPKNAPFLDHYRYVADLCFLVMEAHSCQATGSPRKHFGILLRRPLIAGSTGPFSIS